MHCLVATFPHSNMRYVAAMPGENAECVCEGLAQIFDHIGMPPRAGATRACQVVCVWGVFYK